MNPLELSNYEVSELEAGELIMNNGGFIALTILGVTYTAVQVASACGIAFGAGLAIGAAAAAN